MIKNFTDNLGHKTKVSHKFSVSKIHRQSDKIKKNFLKLSKGIMDKKIKLPKPKEGHLTKAQIMFELGLFVSVIILLVSFVLFAGSSSRWHYAAVIGVFILFDSISLRVNRFSTLNLLFKKKVKKFISLYLGLFALGFVINFIGTSLLELWFYTDILDTGIIGYLFYPFMLISLKEIYSSINYFMKNSVFSILFAAIAGVLIWEVPNLFSKDWIYLIPFGVEIFGINIISIFGWGIIVWGTILIFRNLKVRF